MEKHIGTKGAGADFIAQFIGSKEIVEKDYESKISPAYKKIAEAYAKLNRYAETHPESTRTRPLSVLLKRMLQYAQLQLFISSQGTNGSKKS